MKRWIEALERNLVAELEVQTGVQKLLDQQLQILTRGNARQLPAVLANAEAGIAESRRLEDERAAILRALAAELSIPIGELTLKRLEERLGGEAATLAGHGAELKQRLVHVRECNRQVGLLLRHSVRFIQDLIALATGAAGDARTYTRAGAVGAKAAKTVVAEA